jgi:preprotein translocase subunit SecA
MMEALETAWADYLSFQSEFDRSLSLRSYVRGDTLTDYRTESSRAFDDLLASVRREALKDIFTYPLPGEKIDSIRWKQNSEPISEQVKRLVY